MNFFEFINNENFTNWLINEKKHSTKEQTKLEKLLRAAGFQQAANSGHHDKWYREDKNCGLGNIMVIVSRGTPIPAPRMLNTVLKNWKENRDEKAQEFIANALNGPQGPEIKDWFKSKEINPMVGDLCRIVNMIKNYIEGRKETSQFKRHKKSKI
jgi:predicted RNA binding protein YcfA (HicA-like mRNA interferase family)